MIEIKCQERNTAKVLYWVAAVLLLISSYLIFKALFGVAANGIWVAVFLFLLFTLLFYAIAAYHQRKFNILGATPLFIPHSRIEIGETLRGRIRIKREDFKRVNQVTLANMFYQGGEHNSHSSEFCASKAYCQLKHEPDVTWLDFEVEVHKEGRATEDLGNKKIYWVLSFEYNQDLSVIKRSWRVKIYPA